MTGSRFILDISGAAREHLTATLAKGGVEAASLGAALDRVPAAAFSLGLAEADVQACDASVLVSFLLAVTRTSRFLGGADATRQHPVNLARSLSTLSAQQGHRVGLALRADAPVASWFQPAGGTAADYLRLLSSLWDTWPMDAMVGDTQAGVFVDDQRIVRISDPAYPDIGGPLTLPTDMAQKPPLVLVGEAAADAAIDLTLAPSAAGACAGNGVTLRTGAATLADLLDWQPPLAAGAVRDDLPIREALGLSASRRIATSARAVFLDPLRAAQV